MVKVTNLTKTASPMSATDIAKRLSDELGKEVPAKEVLQEIGKQHKDFCRDKAGRLNASIKGLPPDQSQPIFDLFRHRYSGSTTAVTKPAAKAETAPATARTTSPAKAEPATGAKDPGTRAVTAAPAVSPAPLTKAAPTRPASTSPADGGQHSSSAPPLPVRIQATPPAPPVTPVRPASPTLAQPAARTLPPSPASPAQPPRRPAAPWGGGGGPQGGQRHKRRGGHRSRLQDRTAPMDLKPKEDEIRIVTIYPGMNVRELAERMRVRETELIKKLFMRGIMANINQTLEVETSEMIAGEFGFLADIDKEAPLPATATVETTTDPNKLKTRPPVVTIMGHVDHGKTSLLDAIRETKVTEQEAGGITQRIGAYHVELKDKNTGHNRQIVFLDTPGHEAFTAMRARGARVTDIAVLVVAADDGVMPQTIEAIDHAKAAGVEIVVAVNKIDKAGANPDKVMQQLTEYGLVPEKWGGQTGMVPISAKKRMGIDDLLEYILTLADVMELQANPEGPANGIIIEARMHRGMGPVATVLVQQGTLHVGDNFVVGAVAGKVRAMIDDRGRRLKKAGPSIPVEVMGMPSVPHAGDTFQIVEDERTARVIAERRRSTEQRQKAISHVSLDTLYTQIQEGQLKELNIVVKADVRGSVEAVQQALNGLTTAKVALRIIHSGTGDISESDILLAAASNALVIGFNVKVDPNTRTLANTEHVDIRTYQIIYKLIEDVQKAMEGLLEPEFEEVSVGKMEVRTIFKLDKRGVVIAGGYVLEGKMVRNSKVKVYRNGQEVYAGQLEGLKRFKDDAREVMAGYECGISFEKFPELAAGDIIEAFTLQEKQR